MDYEQALQKALAAVNAQTAQRQTAVNIEAGNAAYGQLKEQADIRRSLERQRLAKRMAEMGIGAPSPLTVQNNSMMAGYGDIGDISRQNRSYTGMQNAMKDRMDADAAAQAARITADMNAAEDASELEETNNRFDRYYRMYMAKKMTRSQFKKKTGMDVRGWAARRRPKPKKLKFKNMYDYLSYMVSHGRMTKDEADKELEKYLTEQKREEGLRNIGAPYPGAPVNDRFFTRSALANHDKNKEIIIQGKESGFIDKKTDEGSLSPQQAWHMAQDVIKKANEAYEHYRKMSIPYPKAPSLGIYEKPHELRMPYPGAPSLGIYEKPHEFGTPYPGAPSLGAFERPKTVPDNLADIDASIKAAEDSLGALEKQMNDANIDAIDALGEPTGEPLTEEQKDAVNRFEEKQRQYNDTNERLKALKSERPYVENAEVRKNIEKVMEADDFLTTAAKGLQVNGMFDKYESVMTLINNPTSSKIPAEVKYKYAELTGEEKNVLRYLYMTGDNETFEKYFDALDLELDKRSTTRDADAIRKVAEGSDFGKVSAGAYSFLTNLASPAALIESARSMITGEPINKYSAFMRPAQLVQTAREASLKDASDVGKWWGNLFYSMGDTALTLPFGPTGSLAIMTSRAAGQAAYDIAQRGGTGAEAFFGGAAAGAIEYFTEKIPIDRLFDVAESGVKFFSKQGLTNILKQAGIEGTEEWISEVLNNFTDYAIMGDRSNLGLKIKDLMARGMSEQDARKNAFSEFFVLNPLEAAAGGAISSGVFATGANAVSHIRTNTQQNIKRNPTENLQNIQKNQIIYQQRFNPLINMQSVEPNQRVDLQNIQPAIQKNALANIPKQNALNTQVQSGDVAPQSMETKTADGNTSTFNTAETLNEKVNSQVQKNIKVNPEGVRNAMGEGISTLTKIKNRLKADGNNSINIEASHKTYVNYISGKGSIETVASTIAGDIRNAVGSGTLTAPEAAQLGGIMADMIGDADLADAYIGQAAAAPEGGGGNPRSGGPEPVMVDVKPGDIIRPLNDGNIKPPTVMDGEGKGGYNKREKATKEIDYSRPSKYRKGMRKETWRLAVAESENGIVKSPGGKVINEEDIWQMGHKPGYEFRKHKKSAEKRGITRKEFLDEYFISEHYRPELPEDNLSHKHEGPEDLNYWDYIK